MSLAVLNHETILVRKSERHGAKCIAHGVQATSILHDLRQLTSSAAASARAPLGPML